MASQYAALVSLVHVLNRVQHPTCLASFEKLQIQSLLHKANSLVHFLESCSQQISHVLARKMLRVAFATEDTIESYVASQVLEKKLLNERKLKKQKIHERSSCDASAQLCQDLEKFIQEMEIIIQEVKVHRSNEDQILIRSFVRIDSSVPRIETIKIAGFDEELKRLMGQLTKHHPKRRIVPIVGMGGIGKTTFAKNVYEHPLFKNYFDVKTWVTMTQDVSSETVIRSLLRDIGVSNVNAICESELGDHLYQCLHGRKYLVIMDNMWDTKVWDEINRFFPDNENGSRILVTTRISNVGRTVGGLCTSFDVKLLDDDKSWDFLSKKVFGEKACPPELKECGKKISASCKGLPLTIVVIAGLLKMSEKTLEYWNYVEENINLIISTEDGEHCMQVLSLSYQQLPICLKPCFLYLATYPRGYEIRVSQLIMLWAADGFLKQNVGCDNNTLEEVASNHLNDLVNRNLVIVKKFGSRGEIKRLSVHDLVMDLCTRQVQKERFLHVDRGDAESSENIENPRRLVFRGSDFTATQPIGSLRSFISFEHDSPRYLSQLSLLRVCYASTTCKAEDLMQLVNLRLLRLSLYDFDLSMFSEISMLSNLETLILYAIPYGYNILLDIWNLRQVKHLIASDIVMVLDPPTVDADSMLLNILTLKRVHIWSDKMIGMIPNIRNLGIHYEHHVDAELLQGFGNLASCHKLEKLSISSTDCAELNTFRFPNSLRKLTLDRSDIPWQSCHIGALPNLEVLKLKGFLFDDGKWSTTEGEFQSLRFLSMEACYLKTWTVDDCSSHFPNLKHLSLGIMRQLQEIPDVFGESTTLERITLNNCLKSAIISAKQILEEQQRQGNEDIAVYILHNRRVQHNVKEMNEFLESMASDDNFHVRFLQ